MITEVAAQDIEILKRAFEQFSRSSDQLKIRYEDLCKEAEELKSQLAQKEIEVRRSERLAMLGQTAAALAHEVRNPLGAIKLFVSVLRGELTDRPASISLVDAIDKSVDDLDHVVTNILQFARDGAINHGVVNVSSIINEQIDQLKGLYSDRIKFIVLNEASPFIEGDSVGIRSLFSNILQNSCQAIKKDGTIKIRLFETNNNANCLLVEVQDTGGGIADEIIKKIFEPFVSGRNEGTGLGLAIAKKVVNQHEGEISVSNSETGAVFKISLPRTLREKNKNKN